jgi:hypothetical protein
LLWNKDQRKMGDTRWYACPAWRQANNDLAIKAYVVEAASRDEAVSKCETWVAEKQPAVLSKHPQYQRVSEIIVVAASGTKTEMSMTMGPIHKAMFAEASRRLPSVPE